jgi:glutamate synthase domain-containing protein 3
MNQQATLNIHGSAGQGTAENMMSGKVVIDGDASQYAGATGHGGLLVIKGNASSRCGISMKDINIVVHGNIHMSAFMVQSGNLVVCGDAESDANPEGFTRYGSARNLYNFDVDNASAY